MVHRVVRETKKKGGFDKGYPMAADNDFAKMKQRMCERERKGERE